MENGRVSEFCFMSTEWCVNGTDLPCPPIRVTKSVPEPISGNPRSEAIFVALAERILAIAILARAVQITRMEIGVAQCDLSPVHLPV